MHTKNMGYTKDTALWELFVRVESWTIEILSLVSWLSALEIKLLTEHKYLALSKRGLQYIPWKSP